MPVHLYVCVSFFACKCEAQIYFLAAWLTESVGGDIHRGAFSGTFMRDFFPWLKGGWPHTVRLPMCTHVHVCACMYVPRRSGALPLSAPTLAARGVLCFVFCFGEPSPVLRKCCRKQWELTPSSASVPLKKELGLSGSREGGGGAVSLGMSWPCGWLSTRSHTLTQPQSRLVLDKLFLYTLFCWHAPSEIPCFRGEF